MSMSSRWGSWRIGGEFDWSFHPHPWAFDFSLNENLVLERVVKSNPLPMLATPWSANMVLGLALMVTM